VLDPFPDSAAVEGGQLTIGGLRATALAEEFGTPLVVVDEETLRARAGAYREAAPDALVAYSVKAFPNVAVLRLLAEEGLGADVSTTGELEYALRAGIDPERIVFHGNNKSADELATALDAGVGRIVADSASELDRLEDLAAKHRRTPRVLLRVTPGVEAHTHEYVMTGQVDSKFGFGLASGDAALAVDRIAGSPAMS